MAVAFPNIENAINVEIAVMALMKLVAQTPEIHKDADQDSGNVSTVIAFHYRVSVMADQTVGINQMNEIVVSIFCVLINFTAFSMYKSLFN